MTQVDWYYDFISPFAYLASQRLARLPAGTLRYRPVLFAGLLGHWEHRGPAEIPAKRLFSYRHVQWLAQREGIALRMPAAHPFNPLPYLRLGIALGNSAGVVDTIFRHLWQTGGDPGDPRTLSVLCAELGVADAAARIAAPAVKQELRDNTEQALASGVFGVPTFVVDGELFWGFDAMDFLAAYLADPRVLQTPAMRALQRLPIGVQRTGS